METEITSSGETALLGGYVTYAAIGITAWPIADMTHEVLGHMTAAWLVGDPILSLSTVAIQTAAASRTVSAAGTLAQLVIGALCLIIFDRTRRRTNFSYFLWTFSAFNLLSSGYLAASAFVGGDWAAVIRGLSPAWAWTSGLAAVGVAIYVACVSWLSSSMARKEIGQQHLQRLVLASYLGGGAICTIASALNPISPWLILVSGMGASFGLNAGMLRVPSIAAKRTPKDLKPRQQEPMASPGWIIAAIVVGLAYVAVLGPGIHLHK